MTVERMLNEMDKMTEKQLRKSMRYVIFYSENVREQGVKMEHDAFSSMVITALEVGKE